MLFRDKIYNMDQQNNNSPEQHEPKPLSEYVPDAIDRIVSGQEAGELYDLQPVLLGRLRRQKNVPGTHKIEEEISDVHDQLAKFSADSERNRSNTEQ